MVQVGEAQVLVGQAPQAGDRLLQGEVAPLERLQELLQLPFLDGCPSFGGEGRGDCSTGPALRKRRAGRDNGGSMRASLSLLLALWLAALLGFAVMAGFAAAYDRFPADLWLAHRLQGIEAAAFLRALDWAEDLSDAPLIAVVWVAGAAALWALTGPWRALLLIGGMGGWLLNGAVKALIQRPRPSPELVEVSHPASGYSFPSGHAEASMILYGLLFYFAGLIRQRPLRLLVRAASLWVVLFDGMERVQVGAHWPSDVLGGFLLGGIIAAGLIALERALVGRQ